MAASVNRIMSEGFVLKFRFWINITCGSSVIPNFVVRKSAFSSNSSSSDSSSSDDEEVKKKVTKETAPKKPQISDKLASLLSEVKIETSIPPEKSLITLKLAKPLPRRQNKNNLKQQSERLEDERFKRLNPNLKKAVKDVASSLGGDVKNTESELLLRLRSHSNENKEVLNVDESESVKNISDVFTGMKIDKSKPKPKFDQRSRRMYEDRDQILFPRGEKHRKQPIVSHLPEKIYTGMKQFHHYDNFLFSRVIKILLILSIMFYILDIPETALWNELKEHNLKLLVTHPPKNAFEEMIRWTEEGKLWKFPINNEQGIEEEKKVGFHEHVFLEPLLEGFPKKGPIRHFMELVIVGLSKNPYITVERKKEHIEWYRQYFKDKENILKEVDESILQ
ncbi:28S ribosomal protein S31, mitochondrial-like [Centruroides sculpturatus]|uniref:28S ribosomal protein S31, mitochondrial-like n=1 Tax=Centruroides sculpturatus TaxID=218467 RepID=UPI000C6D9108|nr:28S ribosomal protein S31, mitochondrial-like [Centruroides sculpturatus]